MCAQGAESCGHWVHHQTVLQHLRAPSCALLGMIPPSRCFTNTHLSDAMDSLSPCAQHPQRVPLTMTALEIGRHQHVDAQAQLML